MFKALNKIMQAAGKEDISEKIIKQHSGLSGGTMLGQLLQLLGLASTSVTINALLVQASVIFVPLLEQSQPVSRASAESAHFGACGQWC